MSDLGSEAADVANVSLTGQEAPRDLMESFQVADVDLVSNMFPLEKMKVVLEDIYRKKRETSLILLSLIAQSLDIPEDYLASKHFTSSHRSILRITRYPALKDCTNDRGAGVSRISPHQDIGTITLLSQDACGGLEVFDRKANDGDGEWLPVTPIPGTLVVNIGNLLMRWSNYVYRSSVHRVISTANSDEEDRLSIIFFANPNDNAIVEAIPTTVSEDRPAFFEPFVVGEYLSCKFTQLFDPEARDRKGKCEFDD
jgi:isopenicillin N synthase-like dioxygenase